MDNYIDDLINNYEFVIEDTKSDKLYHYTNVTGLRGIISNSEFWVSKSDFLNDSMEMNYLLNIVVEAFKELPELDEDFREHALHKYRAIVENNYCLFNSPLITHIMSFSCNNDSLALWANYSNFEGYNIEFKKSSLINSFINNLDNKQIFGFRFGKVNYSRIKQKRIIKSLILLRYEQWKLTRDTEIIILLNAEFLWYSLFFKSPRFEQEEEYRIAFSINADNYYDYVDFTQTNQSLKPFIKIKFSNKSIISNITIGPKNNMDIAEVGLIHLLNKYQFYDVGIKYSDITLRY